jgi:hypothetical protein
VRSLPTPRQIDAILNSLRSVDHDALRHDLEQAIEHERRHGGAHDGWSRGTKWTSSTEAAGIARAEGNYRGDPQRAQLNRAIERLVRGVADVVQAQADLARLRASQGHTGATEATDAVRKA